MGVSCRGPIPSNQGVASQMELLCGSHARRTVAFPRGEESGCFAVASSLAEGGSTWVKRTCGRSTAGTPRTGRSVGDPRVVAEDWAMSNLVRGRGSRVQGCPVGVVQANGVAQEARAKPWQQFSDRILWMLRPVVFVTRS